MKKRAVTMLLALSMLMGTATPALAYPDKPTKWYDEIYKSIEGYDGTWRSIALMSAPDLPEPSDWAALPIYIAVCQDLYYKREYDKETNTVSPEFKPWNAPMTRNDFAEMLYEVLEKGVSDGISRAVDVQSHLDGWREISPKLTAVDHKLQAEYDKYYNGYYRSDLRFDLTYSSYREKGGSLDATSFSECVLPYLDTLPDYQRVYQFADCENMWAEKLADLGIIEADAQGNFYPDRPITQQEAAYYMARTLEVLGIPAVARPDLQYADDGEIADWAREAVYQLSSLQEFGEPLIQGDGDNRFNPESELTNEQALALAVRLKYFISHYIYVTVK